LSAGLRPDPLGELTALPQTPQLDLKGPTSKEGKGKGRDGRGGEGRGGKALGPALPAYNFWLRHCQKYPLHFATSHN